MGRLLSFVDEIRRFIKEQRRRTQAEAAIGARPLPFGMDDPHLFDELLRVAETLGVAVRVEPFETPAPAGGGSCVFRGERLVLIDATAPFQVRIAALARALAELGTETVFMAPEARKVVENWAREGDT